MTTTSKIRPLYLQRLGRLRELKDIETEDMAEYLSISPGHLRKIEAGEREMQSDIFPKYIERLARSETEANILLKINEAIASDISRIENCLEMADFEFLCIRDRSKATSLSVGQQSKNRESQQSDLSPTTDNFASSMVVSNAKSVHQALASAINPCIAVDPVGMVLGMNAPYRRLFGINNEDLWCHDVWQIAYSRFSLNSKVFRSLHKPLTKESPRLFLYTFSIFASEYLASPQWCKIEKILLKSLEGFAKYWPDAASVDDIFDDVTPVDRINYSTKNCKVMTITIKYLVGEKHNIAITPNTFFPITLWTIMPSDSNAREIWHELILTSDLPPSYSYEYGIKTYDDWCQKISKPMSQMISGWINY